MNKKTIRKAMSSYDKIIKMHIEKIKREKLKESPDIGLIDYWEKEVENFKNNREKKFKKLF